MVLEQPPIMRDFLGLGKLVTDDQGQEEDSHGVRTIQDFHPLSLNMDFTGVKHPVCNIGLSTEHNFPLRKASEERHLLEGTAESYGLACARQFQGPVSATNTTMSRPPARVLASDAYAKPNGTQLTIFYGGHVNVYDNIPVDQAQAIMQLAFKGNSWSSNVPIPASLGVSHALAAQGFCQPAGIPENLGLNAQIGPMHFAADQAADQASQNGPPANKQFDIVTPSSASSSQHVVPRALPLARKASLARFLERRKERMQMMSPYFKQQLPPAQVLSAGDQIVGSFHGAALAKLYDDYFRGPLSTVYGMQERIAAYNDISSHGIPPKE